jgi:antitoxin YefM
VTAITAAKAKNRLSEILNEISLSHEPVQIVGKDTSGVLISEDDWRSIQETLYLVSIPGMRDSIRKGLKTPINKCSKDLPW